MRHQYFFQWYKLLLLGGLLIGLPALGNAQPGCTDPQASNYDNTATANDGSCVYDPTNYSLQLIAELPAVLKECSGIQWIDDELYIHNDAGNAEQIYRIDPGTGLIAFNHLLENGDNVDWEDLTENADYLFLGDFGNNIGNRTDLTIYRIAKTELDVVLLEADKITFTFEDQTDFSEQPNNHDFDCEAMVYYNDSLHLFTKNWVDERTRHYVLTAEPGDHTARLRESYDVQGLITSADISDSGELVLLGYTATGLNFMWLLFDFQGAQFFSGNKRRIELGNGLTNSQTEGITFQEGRNGLICSEAFEVSQTLTLPQKLLAFSIEDWIDETTRVEDLEFTAQVQLYPNPATETLFLQADKNLSWQAYDEQGRLMISGRYLQGTTTRIECGHWSAGVYWIQLEDAQGAKLSKAITR